MRLLIVKSSFYIVKEIIVNKIKFLILLFLVNVGVGNALTDAEVLFKNATLNKLHQQEKPELAKLMSDMFRYSIDDEIVPEEKRPICHRFNIAFNRMVCHWHIVNGCFLPKLDQFKDLTDGLTGREKYLLQVASLIKCGEAGAPNAIDYKINEGEVFYGYPKTGHASSCFKYLTSRQEYVTVEGDFLNFDKLFEEFGVSDTERKIIAAIILACKSFQLLYDPAKITWIKFLQERDKILTEVGCLPYDEFAPHLNQMIAVLAIAELFSVYFEPMQTAEESLILGDFVQIPARRVFVNDGGLYPYKNGNETEEYAQVKYCKDAFSKFIKWFDFIKVR